MIQKPHEISSVLDELKQIYEHPSRIYHNIHHINTMLEKLKECQHLTKHPFRIEWAIWFHDSVYDATAHNNEIKSSELWIRKTALYLDEDTLEWGRRAILATIDHVLNSDIDIQILIDLDLAGLGADYKTFCDNTEKIRQEYCHVPIDQFTKGRAEFLKKILKRRRIFGTDFWHDRLEEQARSNLQRATQ